MEQPYYVAGEWASDGRELEVVSPSDGGVVGTTCRPPGSSVDLAVEGAVRAFAETRAAPVHRRVDLLKRIASGIGERGESFAGIIAKEVGKPIRVARGEVDRAVQTFTFLAEPI
ncbi:MAG: aldehyde dehydrogenase family protein [Candidatus Krumholzibacteria bacterium]|nr:aldehyde dehydrogenase family protein [Candidatus Krumholzibacteria bacterium]